VESRVMHTCCGRMLKFIRCVRDKFAGQILEVPEVRVGHYYHYSDKK